VGDGRCEAAAGSGGAAASSAGGLLRAVATGPPIELSFQGGSGEGTPVNFSRV
jgi:hypothetical protein